LKIKLPSPLENTQKPDIDPAFFYVHSDGSIDQVVSGALSPMAEAGDPDVLHRTPNDTRMAILNDAVSAYVSIAKENAIIKVQAEPDVKAQYVVDLMNLLAHHNVENITFTELSELN